MHTDTLGIIFCWQTYHQKDETKKCMVLRSYEKKSVAVLVYGSVAVWDFEFMAVAVLDMACSRFGHGL